MNQQKAIPWLLFVPSLLAYLGLGYLELRTDLSGAPQLADAFLPLGLFALLFALYGLTFLNGPDRNYRAYLSMGLLFRLGLVFALPSLSDDFYRFIWDGRLLAAGMDPFAYTPREWMTQVFSPEQQAAFADLWPHLNSQGYYSVYPPVLQSVFWVAVKLGGGSLYASIVVLKLFVLAAEVLSIYLLDRIALRFQLKRSVVLLYALNPLVIVELTGNLHFEAFMVSFMLLAFWLLMRQQMVLSAGAMALAISSKLLPLMIFPFLIRRMGWLRTLLYGSLTVAFTAGLFALFMDLETLGHFRESVKLYFEKFVYHPGIWGALAWLLNVLGGLGYWANRILPVLTVLVIVYGAWKEKNKVWKGLPAMVLLAFATYQLLSPVVHPWYIVPLVAFAAMSPYRFPVVWSAVWSLTYVTYYLPGYAVPWWLRWLLWLPVLLAVAYEWQFVARGHTLETWALERPWVRRWIARSIPARMAIKLERIAACLPEGARVLDIGTGHGGLVRELRAKGYAVDTVDVKNISFFEDVQPVVYDGQTLPYAAGSYDCTQLITVLHHTPDPSAVLDEAVRVSRKRIVIMEDIYRNVWQQYLTYFVDSLVNLEFAGHPHTNKTDAEWRALFEEKGLRLVKREDFRTLLFFRQVVYVVEK